VECRCSGKQRACTVTCYVGTALAQAKIWESSSGIEYASVMSYK
jgi:hypothetical protein